ncbi:MAG: ABC transporter permease subunit [Clostridiales bacterium]|jgi:putative aldouronate transport system permease protein|nr:ABC transporter permease subunit [Clostridiales bacterium]
MTAAASKNRISGRVSASFIKRAAVLAVCVYAALSLLFLPVVRQEDGAIDLAARFTLADLLAALGNGGAMNYASPEFGTLTVVIPAVCAALFLAAFAAVLCAAVVNAVRLAARGSGKKGAERVGFYTTAGAGASLLAVYAACLFLRAKSVGFKGAEDVFYRVFTPEIAVLLLGAALALTAFIDKGASAANLRRVKRYVPSYLFMALPLALLIIFNLYPVFLQLILSFKNFTLGTGIYNSEWVGFANFRAIFTDAKMLRVIGNTLLISGLRLLASTVPPLCLSVALYDLRFKRMRRITQSIVYIPHFFSWVIIYSVAYALFNEEGILAGLFGLRSNLMNEEKWFLPIVIAFDIWKELGWGTILYMAALSSVDPELYEAARLDGAGPLQRIFRITLPSILPIIVYLLIMSLGNILKAAGGEQLLLFAGAATKSRALVIDTWLYWQGMGEFAYSLGAAMSFFQAAIGLVLVLVCNKLSKKTTGIGMW